ncbi:GNAT family N-acetyltransferase [Nonomuraea roseola]|uniref:N-acetyltransferase family protein n=1 Tax=Nonomuraea roseola TaxID=46179 RepID=A0ABV5Q7S3_9ACTN
MTIRPATAADLAEVAAIYAHYVATSVITFDEVAPEATFWEGRLRELDERGLPFLVADVEGEVAGYAYASQWRPKPAYRHSVEDSIYLAPGRTGRGLGRALLGELLPRCAKAGVRQVVAVIADTGEQGSAALHRSFGFEPAGRLKGVGFKLGRWVDTELMQLDLTG